MMMTLMTVMEVAQMMRVHRNTIYNWIGEGRFVRPIRVGKRQYAFRRVDIDRYIETNTKT